MSFQLSPHVWLDCPAAHCKIHCVLSAWQCFTRSIAGCQLGCDVSSGAFVHFFVRSTVSSGNCSTDVNCHLSSFCRLLSKFSSELQFVCSAATCSSGMTPHISYNFLRTSARTSIAMMCTFCDQSWYSIQMSMTTQQAQKRTPSLNDAVCCR